MQNQQAVSTHDIETLTQVNTQSLLYRISYYMLLGLGFLAPFFFLPNLPMSISVSTSLLVASVVGIVALLYYVLIYRAGVVALPRSYFFGALAVVNIALFISAFVSNDVSNSVVGFGGDIGTAGFMFLNSLVLIFVALIYNTKERILTSYVLFFVTYGIVALHHLARLLFGADFLSFGIFNTATASVLGGWNNVAIFFGIGALIGLTALHMLTLSKVVRMVLNGIVLLSLGFLILVNFTLVWILVGSGAILLWGYNMFYDRFHRTDQSIVKPVKKQTYLSLVCFLCALVFVIGGTRIYTPIAETFNVSVTEVRPSWTATAEIGQQVLTDNFFFGSGPNTFGDIWVTHKPAGVNETMFFNVDFNSGIAFIPTLMSTTGLLGILALIALVGSFMYAGYRTYRKRVEDMFSRYMITSSFIVSVYLWLLLVLYTPSASMVTFTFFFSGLFFAALIREGIVSQITVPFSKNYKVGLLTTIPLVFVMLFTLLCAYWMIESRTSHIYFARSISALETEEGIARAEILLDKANSIKPHDAYYRLRADIDIYKLNDLIVSEIDNKTTEEVQAEFQTLLSSALSAMNQAIALNPFWYENWMKIGQIYASVATPPFSIPGSYENAQKSFEEARRLNPTNPVLSLMSARLELTQDNVPAARTLIEDALSKKINYLEAYFLLSQVEASTGNLAEAIRSAENSVSLAPDNPGILFHLGLLYYNAEQYERSGAVLERAIALVPEYSNAKYFLALTLDKRGRRDEAIALFENILESNPESEEVRVILDNLRNNREPFADVEPPLDDKPEERDELPLDI